MTKFGQNCAFHAMVVAMRIEPCGKIQFSTRDGQTNASFQKTCRRCIQNGLKPICVCCSQRPKTKANEVSFAEVLRNEINKRSSFQ